MTLLPYTVFLLLGVTANVVYATPVDPRGDLIFSHVLYRHGDRTPSEPYPTDPYADPSNWPVPFGALTVLGMQMHFSLGQWLRQRYGNVLLSPQYTPNEIYVRSTDVDRTLQSAECNLAGLYTPSGNQVWNRNLAWQPTSVHTIPSDEDWLIGSSVPKCPVFKNATSQLETVHEIKELLKSAKPIMKIIKEHSGLPITYTIDGLNKVNKFRQTLFIEAFYNKT